MRLRGFFSTHRWTGVAVVLLLWASTGATAQEGADVVSLIKDINQESSPVDLLSGHGPRAPSDFVQVGSVIFFAAYYSSTDDVPSNGVELWKTTGTGRTPELVADINPGRDWSDPSSLTAVGDTLFFAADDGVHGRELWKSDGTVAGTMLVKDINPDAGGGGSPFAALGDTLFFVANDGVHGTGLWKSDGTEEGTVLLKNIIPDRGGFFSSTPFAAVGGTLFFAADDGVHGKELWKTDGTVAGTMLVKDINPDAGGIPRDQEFAVVGGTLFFVANDGVTGLELWRSDGTPEGTMLVKDINPDGGLTIPNLTAASGTLFFTGNGFWEQELWKSDGTEAGTVPVTDINDETIIVFRFLLHPHFAAVNGTLFFVRGGLSPVSSLWKTDGTPDGTREVTSLPLFTAPLTAGHQVFFPGFDPIHGCELWKSDGTDAGTMLVKDINPGAEDGGCGFSSFPDQRPAAVGDDVVFWANDGVANGLWRSDGTEEGTVPVETVGFVEGSSRIFFLTAVGDSVFFAADDGVTGTELWKSDGTPEGTMLVKDISPGEFPAFLAGFRDPFFTAVNDTLFFAPLGQTLWKSDGTPEGTVLVKDSSFLFVPTTLTALNGTLFFFNSGLWKSDGTEEGTVLVKDLGFNPITDEIVAAGGTLFFSASERFSNRRFLWKSDGTEEGTVPVILTNGQPGDPLGALERLTAVNDSVFFAGFSFEPNRWGLWRSDGTAEGTIALNDGPDSSVRSLTAVDDTLFFRRSDAIRGPELWKSDGTVEGTLLVKAIAPGNLTAAGDTLFFRHDDAIRGPELWKSDGTEAGTVPVKAIKPVPVKAFSLSPPFSYYDVYASPVVTGDPRGLLFAADGDGAGIEPWGSNGEESGTLQVQDIAPGSFSSNPRNFTVAGSRVIFVADDGTHGAELWGGRVAILMRNPAAAARDLADEVQALGLGRGIETSLIAKLNQMERVLGNPEHHDSPAALHLVEAFMREVLAQRGGAILNEDADDLLDFAEQIVELLSDEGAE